MNRFLVLIALITFVSFSSNQETIYLKRDNKIYADLVLADFVCKIEKNSFTIVEYLEISNAWVYKGRVEGKDRNNFKLMVATQSCTSLNTGQIIKPTQQVEGIIYEVNLTDTGAYKIQKWEAGQLNPTFRSDGFEVVDTINSIEKKFLNLP